MLIPVYKPLGSSSHQLAKKVGETYGEKATHTGTLDPMAEGVLVVLTGEDRFKKTEYSHWQKTYQFKVLVGFETDTHDLLGLIKNIDHKKINQPVFEKNLKSFIGRQQQLVPKFSAQRINGQSGFDLAKKNQPFDLQKNEIEILALEILNKETVNSNELFAYINRTINLVVGNFRQAKILTNWEKVLANQKNYELITIEAVTSKRTYIRALVRDFSKKLNLALTTYSIVRTKNGKFTIDDCKTIA